MPLSRTPLPLFFWNAAVDLIVENTGSCKGASIYDVRTEGGGGYLQKQT